MVVHYVNQEHPSEYLSAGWDQVYALHRRVLRERRYVERIDMTYEEEQYFLRGKWYLHPQPMQPRRLVGMEYTVARDADGASRP